MKTWYGVTTAFYDSGKATAAITSIIDAEDEPESHYTSARDRDRLVRNAGRSRESCRGCKEGVMETETNRYVIRDSADGTGGFLIAYSETDFPIGAKVNVLHHTRFDGDVWDCGYVIHKGKQTLIDGKLPLPWDGKPLSRIGTVDMVLA